MLRPKPILLAVLLGTFGSLASSDDQCFTPTSLAKGLLLRKKGPEIDLEQISVSSGLTTELKETLDIGIQGAAVSAFTVDSQNQMLYIIPSAPPLRLQRFALAADSARWMGDLALQVEGATSSLQNLWNVEPHEAEGGLMAVSPSSSGFNTTVLSINTTSGIVEEIMEVEGAPLRGLHALDKRGHRYFFAVLDGMQRFLVNLHLPTRTMQRFELVVEGMVGIHFDEARCRLLGAYLRAPGVVSLQEIDLELELVGEELTALSPAVSLEVQAYEFVGMTTLTSTSEGTHVMCRDPRTSSITIFHLEDGLRYTQAASTDGLIALAARIEPQPRFYSHTPDTAAQLGGSLITFKGNDFGVRDLTPVLMFGTSPAQRVIWVSDSCMRAQVASGTGSVGVSIMVHGVSVDMGDSQIQFVMAWNGVSPSSASVVGGEQITLSGGIFVENQGDYYCEFGGQIQTKGTVASGAEEVVCSVPLWPFSEGPATLDLLLGGIPVKNDASGVFEFTSGVPATLSVETAPETATGGQFLTPAVEVVAKDSAGRMVSKFADAVYLRVYEYLSRNVTALMPNNNLSNGSSLVSNVVTFLSNETVASGVVNGQTNSIPVNGVATFLFSIDRHGKYLVVFSNCSASSTLLESCMQTNTTVEVLVGTMASVASNNFPSTVLAGRDILPQPNMQILDSGGNVANISVWISATILADAMDVGFSYSPIKTVEGHGSFTDMKINKIGSYLIMFHVEEGGPALNISVEVVLSPPTYLYNRGGNPFGMMDSMQFMEPFPSIWVLDAGRNRIMDTYWIQDPFGIKVMRHLDLVIDASLTTAFEDTSLFNSGDTFKPLVPSFPMPLNVSRPGGSLFGTTQIRLVTDPNSVTECPGRLSPVNSTKVNCSGHGSCLDSACICSQGWRGEGCWLPEEDFLCGEACPSKIGTWVNGACSCLEGRYLAAHQVAAANFSELMIDLQGNGYILLFTSPDMGSARSFVFHVLEGVAHHLWVISEPGGGRGGGELDNVPVVEVRDTGKNPIVGHEAGANASIVVQLVDGDPNATLTGVLNRTAEQGYAYFVGLRIDKAIFTYRLKFISPGLIEAFTEPFVVQVGDPARLEFLTQPADMEGLNLTATGGSPFPIQPQIRLLDPGGNLVTGSPVYSVSVSLLTSTVVFNCSNATTSGSWMNTTNPTSATYWGNNTNTTTIDSWGNITNTTNIDIMRNNTNCTAPPPPVLLGTTTVFFSALIPGLAVFDDLAIDQANTGYKLLFTPDTAPLLAPPSITSSLFEVLVGQVAKLVLLQNPTAAAGGRLNLQPVLELQDFGGNRVSQTGLVVAANVTRPGFAITFANSFTSVSGIVETDGLSVTDQGIDYQLIFYVPSRPDITPILSNAFNNTVGLPAKLDIVIQPGNQMSSGDSLNIAPVVRLWDEGNNFVSNDGVLVTASLDYDNFIALSDLPRTDIETELACNATDFLIPVLSGTTQILTVLGIATFPDLTVTRAGVGYTLTFHMGSASTTSETFQVARGDTVTQVHVVCQPVMEKGGESFIRQPVIDFLDVGGNRLPNSTRTVTVSLLTIMNGTLNNASDAILTGTFTSVQDGDLVTFTNLAIDKARDSHVLRFQAEGLDFDDSDPFSIVSGNAVAVSGRILNMPVESGEGIQVDANLRDKGGNVAVQSPSTNITAKLFALQRYDQSLRCTGPHSCLTRLNTTVPEGSYLYSANLSIRIACTDFDYETETITDVKVGDYSLEPTIEYESGPFDGCFRDCLSTRSVVRGYDAVKDVCLDTDGLACYRTLYSSKFEPFETRYSHLQRLQSVDLSVLDLEMMISTDVNFHPCDGFLLNTWVTYSVEYAVPDLGNQLQGTASVATGNGTASFDDLTLGVVDSQFLIGYFADGFAMPGFTRLFTVRPGPVRVLRILTQPGNGTGNTELDPQPHLELLDQAENRVTFATGTMYIVNVAVMKDGNYTASSILLGQTSISSVKGEARFTDLLVGPVGVGYVLEFSFGINQLYPSHSGPFKIEVGNAFRLSLMLQPLYGSGGDPFLQQPIVLILDWSNNRVAANATIVIASIENNGGVTGTLSGMYETGAVGGRVVYTDLAIDRAGQGYTLRFSSSHLQDVISERFSINKGNATRLGIVRQPSNGRVSMLMSVQPAVAVLDNGGNTIDDWIGSVNVVIGFKGTSVHTALDVNSNVSLIGTTTGYMFEGVAYFGNLKVDQQGIGFVLNFTASGLIGVSSDPFDVYGGAATHLKVIALPTIARAVMLLPESVVVAVDENDNVDGTFVHEAVVSLVLGPEETMLPPLISGVPVVFTKGLASFRQLQVTEASLQLRLKVSSYGITVTSDPFDVINAFTGIWNMYYPTDMPTYTTLSMGVTNQGSVSATWNSYSFDSGFKPTEDLPGGCKSVAGRITIGATGQGGAYFENCEQGTMTGQAATKVSLDLTPNTTWVRDLKFIQVEEYLPEYGVADYVLIANGYNGTTYSVDASMYRWQNGNLVFHHHIQGTKGAHDIEYFMLGRAHYLIVANHFDDGGIGFGSPSLIYILQWSEDEQKYIFEPIQSISTAGSVSWACFEIDGEKYVAVANYFNGSHFDIDSKVFHLDRTEPDTAVPRTVFVQAIATQGARDVAYFQASDKHFLAYANRFGGSVAIYQWSWPDSKFMPFQTVAFSAPMSLSAMRVQDHSLLAVANFAHQGADSDAQNGTALLEYNDEGDVFEVSQELSGSKTSYTAVFQNTEGAFLLVVNAPVAGASGSFDVYKWEGTQLRPQFAVPMEYTYAVAMASIPCNSTSVRGVSCGNDAFEQVIVAANGWGKGLDVLQVFPLNASIMATHLMVTSPTPEASVTNQTLVPPTHARLQNFGKNVSITWSQPVTASIAVLNQRKAVGQSLPFVSDAVGETAAHVDSAGSAAFSAVRSPQAGNVSVRISSLYLNDVRLARTGTFSVAPGAPAQLQVQGFPQYLVSGSRVQIVVSVHDAFGNFQPNSPSYSVTAAGFGNTTATVSSHPISVVGGVAEVSFLVQGNERNGRIAFSDNSGALKEAISTPLDITGQVWFRNFWTDQAKPGSALVPTSRGIFIHGGANGSTWFDDLIVMGVHSYPYTFTPLMAFPGVMPAARSGHSAVSIYLNGMETVVIIGGTTSSGVIGDAYSLDVQTLMWNDLTATDSNGRTNHAAVNASQLESSGELTMIIAFGGQNRAGAIIGDLRVYRIFQYSIELENSPTARGSPPSPRLNPALVWQNDKGYIFGGQGIDDGVLHSFTLQRDGNSYVVSWESLIPDTDGMVLPRISALNSAVVFQNRLHLITKESESSSVKQFSALDVDRHPVASWLTTVVEGGNIPTADRLTVVEVGVGKYVLFPSNWTGLSAMATVMSLIPSQSLYLDSDLSALSGMAGLTLPTQPLISVRDMLGNIVEGFASDPLVNVLAVDSQDAVVTLGGATSIQARNGLAHFTDLSVDKNSSGVFLRFYSSSLDPVQSPSIPVNRGPAAQIIVTAQPGGVFFGEQFFNQPAAEIQDTAGNRVFEDSYSVLSATLELKIGENSFSDQSSFLQGTKALTAVRGRVQYTNLVILAGAAQSQSDPVFRIKIERAGVISGISDDFTTTRPEDTTPEVVASFTGATARCPVESDIQAGGCGSALPAKTGVAGVPFTIQPTVRLVVTGSNLLYLEANKAITASLRRVSNDTAMPSSFIGNVIALTNGGYANFTDLGVTKVATDFIISFEGNGFSRVDTQPFAVVPGRPRHVDVTRQVAGASAGVPFSQQPRLVVTDVNGNLLSSSAAVTATLLLDSAFRTMKGTQVVSTFDGVASFTNLAVDHIAEGYSLSFLVLDECCGKNDTANSATFNVTGSTPTQLWEDTPPSAAIAANPFPTQPVVTVQDAGGNPVTNINGTMVTAAIAKDDTLRFNVLQGVTVQGNDVEHLEPFVANGTRYVAAAFSYQGTTYNLNSRLYKWDPVSELLQSIQEIPTKGAQYWKHVQVGDRHFLFLANAFDQVQTTPIVLGTYMTNSKIFELVNGQLVEIETFATDGAKSIESFEISGRTFILVANSFNDTSVNVRSKLYAFNASSTTKLTLLQSIYTSSANVWHHFRDQTGDFLAVGLYFDLNSASYTANSVIYKLSGGLLVPVVTFETQGVVRIESFTVQSRTYVAVANSIDSTGADNGGSCNIYEFSGGSLVRQQSFIGLKGITDMVHFRLNDQDWLALGSNPIDSTPSSMIVLNWDSSNCSSTAPCAVNFTQYTKIATDDCRSVAHFKEGAKHYIVYGGNTGLDTIAFFSNAALKGTVAVPVLNGYARFTDLEINLAQDFFKLEYEAAGLTLAVGQAFTVSVGAASSLSFLKNPSVAVGGEAFVTQPIVVMVDGGGNRLPQAPAGAEYVSVTIHSSGESTGVRGRSSVSAMSGAATFTDLGLNRATWTVLSFNASSLEGVLVNMTVVSGAAFKVSVHTAGTLAYGGISFGTQPSVNILDMGGNVVLSDSTATVSVSGINPDTLSVTSVSAANMQSTSSAASEVLTIGGNRKVLVSSNTGNAYLYRWGCDSPVLEQTLSAASPIGLASWQLDGWLWLAVGSMSEVDLFAYIPSQQQFVSISNFTIPGSSSMNAIEVGGQQFLMVGTALFEFKRTSQGSASVTDDQLELSLLQNITFDSTIDTVTHFEDNYIEYLLIGSGSSTLQLYAWDDNKFTLNETRAQAAADVLVYEVDQMPVLVVTHGTDAELVNLRVEPNVVSMNSNFGSAVTIPSLGTNSKIAHYKIGTSHILAFTSAAGTTTNIYKGDGLAYSLVWGTVSAGYDTVAMFLTQGILYLVASGSGNAIYRLAGEGSLSGTTTAEAVNGRVVFTDLSLDLVGTYDLDFLPISLEAKYETHDRLVAAAVTHNVTATFGIAEALAPGSAPEVGSTPAVVVVDGGGNNLTTVSTGSVTAVLDNPARFPNLTDSSQISSTGARDVNHLVIGSTHYIAVANNYDGSTYSIDSSILRWDGSGLVFLQSLETKGAYDFESFSVTKQTITESEVSKETTTYLAVANHYNDQAGSYVTESVVYRWNNITQEFASFQTIETTGATHWESFTILGVQYLAVANFFDGTFHSVNSVVYKWSATHHNFSTHQEIPTVGAHHISYIEEGGKHFLVIAQFRAGDEVSLSSSSLLYRWDEATERFVRVLSFQTSAAMHVETFHINDVAYVAVANYANSTDGDLQMDSYLYKLECNGEDDTMKLVQRIPTEGAAMWKYFQRAGNHYLAVSHWIPETLNSNKVVVYLYDGSIFTEYSSGTSTGAFALEFMFADGAYYSLQANPGDPSSQVQQFVRTDGSTTWYPQSTTESISEGRAEFATISGQILASDGSVADSWAVDFDGLPLEGTGIGPYS